MRRIGGLGGLANLMSPDVQELLRRLSERAGVAHTRRRLGALLAADGPPADGDGDGGARAAALERRLAQAVGAYAEEDLPSMTAQAVGHVLRDGEAADEWLRWALETDLVLRGLTVRCQACGLRQWRRLTDTLPTLVCAGCAGVVDEPFGIRNAEFAYRASTRLTRALDQDVLCHLLALRWLCLLGHAEDDGPVFGGYPGVEFREPDVADALAEAAVVVVLSDGRMLLGECKTTARGLAATDLEKLWRLADRVGAAGTFVATLDSSAACGPVWREEGGRDHFALTAEHLFENHPIAVLGDAPLAWRHSYRLGPGPDPVDADTFARAFCDGLKRRREPAWWSQPAWRERG